MTMTENSDELLAIAKRQIRLYQDILVAIYALVDDESVPERVRIAITEVMQNIPWRHPDTQH
jgi:hypothetical protein